MSNRPFFAFFTSVLFAAACSSSKPGATPPPETPTTPPPTLPAPPLPPEAPPAAAAAVHPVSGGTLLVLRDGRTAMASDPDRDRIFVADLVTQTLKAEVKLETGAEPGRLVEDGDGLVHVALRSGGAIVTVNPKNGSIVNRRSLCAAPRGLAFDAAKNLVHVACAGGELVSIGPVAAAPSRTLRLDRDLRDVVVQGDRLLVSTFRKSELLVVGDTGVAQRVTPGRTHAVFNTFSRKERPPTVGGGGAAIEEGASASPAVAWRLVPAPGGRVMMLHQRGVDDEIGTDPGAYSNGTTCAGIVESVVSAYDAATGQMRSGRAMANTVGAVDMAVSPSGHMVAVVRVGEAVRQQRLQFFSDGQVTDPSKPEDPCVGGTTTTDGMDVPVDPPVDSDGLPVPIAYYPPNGEVVAVAFDPRGNVVVQSREPATLEILTQRSKAIVLSSESRADPGHDRFHTATRGLVACVSCHAEGGEDGRLWHFVGIGPRRTQSLRGGIMDTAPFHWGGELRNLDHLMHDVFQGRMGGEPVDRAGVEVLARWLDRIPAIKSAPVSDTSALGRGQVLFATTGCASCHNGKHYTNSTTYDVGTGGMFQVPQLGSLAYRAPFMHNGCAATLADRFGGKCGGDDRHGTTSKLTPDQINDLVAYLETL